MEIVIAGGGVAGLEALLALRDLAGDRVRLTLIAPDAEFSYKPLAVARPFALGSPHRVPLAKFAETVGAELVAGLVYGADDAAGEVHIGGGATLAFDQLLLAPGARPVEGVPGATTWWPDGDAEAYGGLLEDLEQGYSQRLAIVIPPGAVWPLPAYELALMTAGEARSMGHEVEVVVVTPERTPLSLFGGEAGAAVAEELDRAGVALHTSVTVRMERGVLVLDPGGKRLDGFRVFAVPRLLGPGIAGVPCDEEGFVRAGDDGRVEGCERIWAAGDGADAPIKFGGLATHQARCAAAAIARLAGIEDVEDPGEPILQGRLLIGQGTRRLRGRGDGDAAPLWWPSGKVAGRYLPRWLVEHGVVPQGAAEPPAGGVEVRRSLSAMRGEEAQYLRDLARRFRTTSDDVERLAPRDPDARP